MKKIVLLILLLLLLCKFDIYAQNSIEQKTKVLLQNVETSEGNDKVNAYTSLLEYLVYTQPLLVDSIAKEAIQISRKLNNKKAETEIIISLGYAHAKLHEPLEALKYYQQAYQLAKKIKDSTEICKVLIKIGSAKLTKGDINESIGHFIEAENIAISLDDNINLIDATNYLGISYYLIDNLDEAIKFSEDALKRSIEIGYRDGEALAYEHLTIVKIKQSKFDEALKLNNNALIIREELDDLQSVAGLYYNFSVIYNNLNDFPKAIEYTKKSVATRKSFGNISGVGSNYLTLGNIYIRSNQIDSALVYLKKAYEIKIEYGEMRALTSIVKSLSDVYEKKNDFKNAFKYLKAYKIYSDSLFGENSRRLASKVLAQQELVRKEDEIKHLQAVNEFQKEIQTFLIIIIVLIFLLSAAFVVLYILNRKANKKLSATNNELINLNRDREKFFKIIAHDLRAPFHPIIGYSDIVLNDIDNMNRDSIKEAVTNINISANKIFDLMTNLLQWLGLNTGRMEYKPINFDLSEELDFTLKLFSNNITNKSLKINNNIKNNTSVYADKSMVGIILRNILSNAIKFSLENGVINISSIQKHHYIEIEIQDYGVGIPADQLESLFTNEMKSTKGTRNESGTGLGLLLCKEMAELNKGNLIVESELHLGTTIKFTLPRSISENIESALKIKEFNQN